MAKQLVSAGVTVVGDIPRNVAPPVLRQSNDALAEIGKAIRRRAMKSMRTRYGQEPHSRPGRYTKAGPQRRYPKSIVSVPDRRRGRVYVGPARLPTRPKKDGSLPGGGKTRPQVLEEGGTIVSPKPTFLRARSVEKRWVLKALAERNRRRKAKGLRPKSLQHMKWVVIPKGTRTVEARPSMRLAMAAVIRNRRLDRYWRDIGLVRMRDRTVRKFRGKRR